MVPYSGVESYRTLEAVLDNRYVWTEGGWWAGGEADACADGMEDIVGWKEAQCGGWLGGKRVAEDDGVEVVEETQPETRTKRKEAPRTTSKSRSKKRRR